MGTNKTQLEELLESPIEREYIELKCWVDMKDPTQKADIARHIAALANWGGGYLIFGFEDNGSQCTAIEHVRETYHPDAVAAIVNKYLAPKFQCDVLFKEKKGILHPIIWVPPHGPKPIISKADGPQDEKKRPQGICKGEIYIRSPKPESISITRSPEQWDELIQRCVLARRDEVLSMFSKIMSGPDFHLSERLPDDKLNEWHDALKNAFTSEAKTKQRLALIRNNIQFSYMLVNPAHEVLSTNKWAERLTRINNAVRDTVHYGWNMFYCFTTKDIPRFTEDDNIGNETEILQGSLIGVSQKEDFWRIAFDGRVGLIRGFLEDTIDTTQRLFDPYIQIRDLVELVRHARAMAEEFTNIEAILFQIEWEGLAGRECRINQKSWSCALSDYSLGKCADKRKRVFKKFSLAEIISDLPEIVAHLYGPVHRMFEPHRVIDSKFISQFLPGYKGF